MSSKIRCLILDDELPGLTYLRMLCEQLSIVQVVRCYSDPKKFLKELDKDAFDVCLLDINMPGITGIEIATQLKGKAIIFISAHPEYAIDAFDLEAVDFIKKPVTRDRLEKAFRKVTPNKPAEEQKAYFTWNTMMGKSTIYFSDILYITTSDTDKRDKLAFLSEGRQLMLKNITIDKLMEFLPSSTFRQVNKSDIVAKKAVQSFTSENIVLNIKTTDRQKFTVALGDTFRKRFTEWI